MNRPTVCLLLLVTFLSAAGPTPVRADSNGVVFYLTDFGINQWSPALAVGGDLSKAQNTLFPTDDPSVVGIAVPMPTDAALSIPEPRLRAYITAAVKARVEEAYAKGARTFEIQLVENINSAGYADGHRQDLVRNFGNTAYAALGDVITQLEEKGVAVNSYAVAGSNGTEILAASIETLKHNGRVYLDGVDLIDGRAHITPTSQLIDAVGARNVRIFNTYGDLPAPHGLRSFRSIANFDTGMDLKDRYPEIELYLLRPTWQSLDPRANHIASIRQADRTFTVQAYIGNGYLQSAGDRPFSSRELRRMLTEGSHRWISALDQATLGASASPAPSIAFGDWVRVHADRIDDLATAVVAYANLLKEAGPEALTKLHLPGRTKTLSKREAGLLKSGEFVQSAFALAQAVELDRSENSYGRYVFLRSHTLEAIGQFGIDLLGFLDLEENLKLDKSINSALRHVGGYRALLTGMTKHVGSGRFDADIADHYLEGIKSLAMAEFKHAKTLKSSFALLDGLQELAIAGTKHAGGKRLDVDVVTGYLDAVNNLAWTGVGMAVCKAEYACTKAIQGFGMSLAKVLRKTSEPLFSMEVLAVRGQARKLVDQYLTLQQRRMADGLEVQTISAVYSADLLRKNGLSEAQIAELDAAARLAALTQAERPKQSVAAGRPSSTVVNTQGGNDDRGGANFDPGNPQIIESDLSATTRSVLGAKP